MRICFKIVVSYISIIAKNQPYRDFSSGPVVKTSLPNAGGAGSVLGQGVKIPHTSWVKKPEHKNRSCIVTNSIKT